MEPTTRPVVAGVSWLLGSLLAALYVYATVAAIGNWIGMREIASSLSGGLSPSGIVWLSCGVVLPPLALTGALVAGRKKPALQRLLLLVLGLSLVAVMSLNILHLIPTTSYLQ